MTERRANVTGATRTPWAQVHAMAKTLPPEQEAQLLDFTLAASRRRALQDRARWEAHDRAASRYLAEAERRRSRVDWQAAGWACFLAASSLAFWTSVGLVWWRWGA